MLSRGEARSVVQVTLLGRDGDRRMTREEMSAFCMLMLTRMDFPSRRGQLLDIRRWPLAWERHHHRR
jgi:hypothetical protein